MKNASYCVSYGKERGLQQNEQKSSFCYSPFLCYFWQHGGSFELPPFLFLLLDEQLPEQLLQQLAVPLNKPRIW